MMLVQVQFADVFEKLTSLQAFDFPKKYQKYWAKNDREKLLWMDESPFSIFEEFGKTCAKTPRRVI